MFELLTGHGCFEPAATENATADQQHLASIAMLTGESLEIFSWPDLRDQFFFDGTTYESRPSLTSSSHLSIDIGELRFSDNSLPSLEQALAKYNVLDLDDGRAALDFIRACFRLDPSQRPSAKQLLSHDWLVCGQNSDALGACQNGFERSS